jgi:bifunctional DNase/RNase
MIEMELLGVRLEAPSNSPVVMLREVGGRRRVVPIFIGLPEANAIAFALDGVVTPRPLTHDLLVNVLASLGAVLDRVVITALDEGTFFAELHLATPTGPQVISSRPSDAIAVAVRVSAPIFALEPVVDEAGAEIEPSDESVPDRDEVVEEFRTFIENVNPEDFAS